MTARGAARDKRNRVLSRQRPARGSAARSGRRGAGERSPRGPRAERTHAAARGCEQRSFGGGGQAAAERRRRGRVMRTKMRRPMKMSASHPRLRMKMSASHRRTTTERGRAGRQSGIAYSRRRGTRRRRSAQRRAQSPRGSWRRRGGFPRRPARGRARGAVALTRHGPPACAGAPRQEQGQGGQGGAAEATGVGSSGGGSRRVREAAAFACLSPDGRPSSRAPNLLMYVGSRDEKYLKKFSSWVAFPTDFENSF